MQLSPELQEAIASAEDVPLSSPAYDRRGFLATGPQFVTPSDVLARAMEEAKLTLAATHYAPGSPDEERRTRKLANGRRLFSAKEAARQRQQRVA